MKCPKCGADVNPADKFCPNCNEEIKQRKGLFPELGPLVDLMYKIEYVDDGSKYLRYFVYVEMAILAIMFIVGFILKNVFTMILSGFLMLVVLLMLWGNNYKTKGFIQFKVGRGMVILVALMTIADIAITIWLTSIGFVF